MGHHAEDSETIPVLGCSQWLTFCMQRFDSEDWFSILDGQGPGAGDVVILTPTLEISEGGW